MQIHLGLVLTEDTQLGCMVYGQLGLLSIWSATHLV